MKTMKFPPQPRKGVFSPTPKRIFIGHGEKGFGDWGGGRRENFSKTFLSF
jgi:hypothetical protein